MKNKFENQIDFEEENSIIQLWRSLKDSIFNVLFVLLDRSNDEGNQSMINLIFQTGLDYLQMMAFPFHSAVINVWNGGETMNNFSALFDNIKISKLIPTVSFTTFLIMLYSLIFVIILVIFDIIYVSYSFSKKKFKFTFPLIFLAYIVPLFVTVFFLPIMQTLLSVVNCVKDETNNSIQVMESFPNVICWQSWHLFHSIITLLFTSIFVFISSVVTLTLFEPRMTSNKLSARRNSTGEVVFIVNKMICQFVFSFTPFSNSWIYCILLFSFSIWIFSIYNIQQPYYNKNCSKFFRIMAAYYFWTNFMLMISQILCIFQLQGGLVVWICGIPFIGISIIFQRKSNIENLFFQNLKFQSGQELESHLRYILLLIHNRSCDKNSSMLLIGYIQKHIDICTEDNCPLKIKHYKKQSKISENQENCLKLLKQIQKMFQDGIKKYPKSTKLHLGFAFFYLQQLKNNHKAYQQFTIAQKTSPSFGQSFIIYRFKKIIGQGLQNQEQGTDLIDAIQFDNYISLCQEAMLISSRLHKQFWVYLQEEKPNLLKLNEIGSKITKNNIIVRQSYAEIVKINENTPQLSQNYALFLLFVLQKNDQGSRIMRQAHKMYKNMSIYHRKTYNTQNNSDYMFDAQMIISANLEQIGKIRYVNIHFSKILGYLRQQITQTRLDHLLPQIYSDCHEIWIKNWLFNDDKCYLDNENQYLNSHHEGYLRHRNGFIIPVEYKIKYQIQQNIFYMNFRRTNTCLTEKIHIITDEHAVIKDISSLAYGYFKLTRQQLLNQHFLQQLGIQFNNLSHDTTNGCIQLIKNIDDNKSQQFIVKRTTIAINKKNNFSVNDENQMDSDMIILGYIYHLNKVQNCIHEKQLYSSSQNNNSLHLCLSSLITLFSKIYSSKKKNSYLSSLSAKNIKLSMTCIANELNLENSQNKLPKYQNSGQIKTYRLQTTNSHKKYKRIYNDEQSQSNYDYEDKVECKLLEHEKALFKTEHYQQKIKQAINTNIDHQEIYCLRKASILYFLVILLFIIWQYLQTLKLINFIKQQNQKNIIKVDDTNFMHHLFQFIGNKSQLSNLDLETIKKYQIKYDIKQLMVQWISNNKQPQIKFITFHNAMVIIQANIINYLTFNSNNINLTYFNYLESIYPNLLSQEHFISFSYINSIIFIPATFIITIAMFAIWIYQLLLIEHKKFRIMIWFLDIPLPYINFFNKSCNRFLKSYTYVRQLTEKGLSFDTEEHCLQSYDRKLISRQNNQEQQQSYNTRKIIIQRYRKITIDKHLQKEYLKICWIFVWALILSFIFLFLFMQIDSTYEKTNNQWHAHYKLYLQSSIFPLTKKLINFPQIDSKYINNFNQKLQNTFMNMQGQKNTMQLRLQILKQQQRFSQIYQIVYSGNLCSIISNQLIIACQESFQHKLKLGFNLYIRKLSNLSLSNLDELEKVQYKYIEPALRNIFMNWYQYLSQKCHSVKNMISLLFYCYEIGSIIIFLSFWLMYLSKLNIKSNQTIQMLNIIPLDVLLSAKKDTKVFIDQLVIQANLELHTYS